MAYIRAGLAPVIMANSVVEYNDVSENLEAEDFILLT
jgi:hypothetical protein